ncbi:MAG: hypothetical protein A2306_05160 [Omnitrophica WOR_2 bacterium RIFOXYB2_FULL_38_16]|nr:MAG: hypothetical protein A2306_05160 [Omnitrophica WOR_2 bacterium RIFOXYB2_FULL_38_16]
MNSTEYLKVLVNVLILKSRKRGLSSCPGKCSLGWSRFTHIKTDDNERAGRWIGTSKCGGECGIHTRPLTSAGLK